MEHNNHSAGYTVGLDIGTNSVGWCVTGQGNEIEKFRGKKMWGVRLFAEGKTAAERRVFRTTRRRLQRRRVRVALLQELIGHEVLRGDSSFFNRLYQSFLHKEDRDQKNYYNLFVGEGFTDEQYFKQYPTIFHLRQDLINRDEPFDIRLVYLALHHILKYRGNFLREGNTFGVNADQDEVVHTLERLVVQVEDDGLTDQEVEHISSAQIENVVNVLFSKIKNAEKRDQIKSELGKGMLFEMFKAVLGYKVKLVAMFGDEAEEGEVEFGKEGSLEGIAEKAGDTYAVLESLYVIYSSIKVHETMHGHDFISQAILQKYDNHKRDLASLKRLIKTYYPEHYEYLFKRMIVSENEKYTGGLYGLHVKSPRLFAQKFSEGGKKNIQSIIKNILEEKTDVLCNNEDYRYCTDRIGEGEFLEKINVASNGVIPYQLHLRELERILENQGKYHPVLRENADKIISILTFRIPYYVGPLNPHSSFGWIERDSQKIYPWNFNETVDREASAERFITRMTNKCTYLPDQEVLPRFSLLYSEYTLLNELNKVRMGGRLLDKATKDLVTDGLFKKQKTVSKKAFEQFLRDHQISSEGELSGTQAETGFTNNLASYIEFSKILGKVNESNKELIEEIIRDLALFEDKKILPERIKEKFNHANIDLSDTQLKKIIALPFKGWGRLSRKLLTEIRSTTDNRSMIEFLRDTNRNLMEILEKNELGFRQQLETYLEDYFGSGKGVEKSIDDLPGSPAVKKGIRQTMRVLEEIVKVKGVSPRYIFLEFARNEDEKKRKKSRIDQILEIYREDGVLHKSSLLDELKELKEKGNQLSNEREYLYFLQQGKCMYTGQALNIDQLNMYHVDHILPRALIKDDSLENKVLVTHTSNVNKLDSPTVPDEIRQKMEPYWKVLLNQGLIGNKKYRNLTRKEYREEDFERFINRQLVETRQIIKHVTSLIKTHYPDVRVFAIRASLSHDFREVHRIPKIRSLNDMHHAQDAYIVSIIGNAIAYSSAFWLIQEHEVGRYTYAEFAKSMSPEDKHGKIMSVVSKSIDNHIGDIKKRLWYRDCLITKQLESSSGLFYNQIPVPKGKASIPLRKGLDPKKYGGYSGENQAYMIGVEYLDKNKTKRELVGIPIYIDSLVSSGQMTYEQYFQKEGYGNARVISKPILKYQPILWNGGRYMIVSSNEMINGKQLIITDQAVLEPLTLIERLGEGKWSSEPTKEQFVHIYNYLVGKLKNEYVSQSTNAERLLEVRDIFNSLDVKAKVGVISEILKITQCNPIRADRLSVIKMSSGIGRLAGKTFKLDEITFISQSVTGLFEKHYAL